MDHLTIRVAWHDNRWNGTVCHAPSHNPYCVALDRVRKNRNEQQEDEMAGYSWADLAQDQLPACVEDSGAFMNEREWIHMVRHPYLENAKAAETHGHLVPRMVTVPPYTTFAVPFWWMLRVNQETINNSLPTSLPDDEEAPFPTPWVFGRDRQNALLRQFFERRLKPGHSLIFFYCKEGHPIDDAISRLVVGVGRILTVGPTMSFDTNRANTYPLWEHMIHHSIRPQGFDGFLLPYHDYLEPTGDTEEDERRKGLLAEIAVPVDPAYIRLFSYVAELAPSDVALSTLVRCLHAVRCIKKHGISKGPWDQREDWLNAQIAATWKDRGAFPGLGSALEALGMRLGTALSLELQATGQIQPDDDPWMVVDPILRGTRPPPQPAYTKDLADVRKTWESLTDERRQLLFLLSRFALSTTQAKRWFDSRTRARTTELGGHDRNLLEDPYLISNKDLGDGTEPAITIGTVDRGLLPDSTIAARHPIPAPSSISSRNDGRRVRAALVAVLREAAQRGDALLSEGEALDRMESLDMSQPCVVSADWLAANEDTLHGEIERVRLEGVSEDDTPIAALQLSALKEREELLAKILSARAERMLPSLGVEWEMLLREAIKGTGTGVDSSDPRHADALAEQSSALDRITTRKLGVLIGRAGTGKTSVLGALLRCDALRRDGILLLAPTGKARVRLGQATGDANAMTIAQFLYSLDRYDGQRQRPLFTGDKQYRRERTVVIDESSMLTMDDLVAVMKALDLAHVQRVILVGDPNQLPPIGVGRPFADLVAHLDAASTSDQSTTQGIAGALARLTVELRTVEKGEPSDALRLASWFTNELQPVDADRVLSDVETDESFNDLDLRFWTSADELYEQLLSSFVRHLPLAGADDVDGFNKVLGFGDDSFVPFDAPDGVVNFQVLSPVRMHPYGVHELNRWVQRQFRRGKLSLARAGRAGSIGNEEIVVNDKVIQLRNGMRDVYDHRARKKQKEYLANGEVGIVASGNSGFLNVLFSGHPHKTFGYRTGVNQLGNSPLELAYALTVHKAQGSEFRKVFVVLPKESRMISRELLYTALTRSRETLVLLIEGDNASTLFDFTRPEKSETARRNTNLFRGAVRRDQADPIPYPNDLIHRTDKGHMVRSKSELVIANILHSMGIDYHYERPLDVPTSTKKLRPDFTFIDPAGDPIVLEHLGMLDRADYRKGWEWKREWYEQNGFRMDANLFTTEEHAHTGIDSPAIRALAAVIKARL